MRKYLVLALLLLFPLLAESQTIRWGGGNAILNIDTVWIMTHTQAAATYAPLIRPTFTGTVTADTLDVLELTQFTGPVAFSAGSGIRQWVDSLTALHEDTLAIWIAGTPWILTKVRATP